MKKIIRIYGIVQGVGFRPTVARHASEYEIKGSVCNKGPFVEVIAQGNEADLEAFIDAIIRRSPQRSVILKTDVSDLEDDRKYNDFQIIESDKVKGKILISPDIAICDECVKEMYTKGNRRYLHPFINCTCCGPRMTILENLPYDRVRTSMKAFEMCPDCEKEYNSEQDRRFDAQPVCCNECGPEVYLLDMLAGKPSEIRGHEAISKVRKLIVDGGIVAIKGIGGYHLCCDASNEDTVNRIRNVKHRPVKPFAVMARNIDCIKDICNVNKFENDILSGHQKPIVLLQKSKYCKVAELAAPYNPKIGLMLPYAPIHHLLFDYDDGIKMPDYLVMTSANSAGIPICKDEERALDELSDICDGILSNNREIRLRADDSVVNFYNDEPYMIRRSRGFAPLPCLYEVSDKAPKVILGIGGELKNSFCIRVEDMCYMSPYIGDMEDVRTIEALKDSINRFKALLEVEPEAVICDLHPRYNTSIVAEELGIPVYKIQHHYAHVLSCMAENNVHGKVIGVSFDGTGYGTDESIWGGEILVADPNDFERIASISPFKQIGGDASSKEGWRIALSMFYDTIGTDESLLDFARNFELCTQEQAKVFTKMFDQNINSILSTSAGRLFDAVSAVLGFCNNSTFEGEAAMHLQFAAECFLDSFDDDNTKEEAVNAFLKAVTKYKCRYEKRLIMPTDLLFSDIVVNRMSGANPVKLAFYFHQALAFMICDACMKIREDSKINTVALTGGVFQNTLLLKSTEKLLIENGFEVIRHKLIPANDGGIALGQAVWTGGF